MNELSVEKPALPKGKFAAFAQRLNPASFCFFCAFLFDCAWSGSGRWLMFGPVSIRMLLLGAAILCAIPSILTQLKKIFTNIYMLCLLAFLVVLAVNAVRGVMSGNNMSILTADLKGFSYYLMFPMLLVIVNSRQRLRWTMRTLAAGSCVLAILSIVIFVVYVVSAGTVALGAQSLFGSLIIAQNPMGPSLLRLFSFSGPYMFAGCVCSFYLFISGKGKLRWIYPVITGLSLFALMVNFTRSLYLGLAAVIVMVLVAIPILLRRYKGMLVFLLIAVLAFAAVLVPVSLTGKTNYFKYAIDKTILSVNPSIASEDNPSYEQQSEEVKESFELTVQSDNMRAKTFAELKEKIAINPIFGRGLGASVECRTNGDTEYFYLNLIHKTGILGFAIYMAPLIIMAAYTVIRLVRRERGQITDMKYLLLCCLAGIMAVSFFNPYMNAALGVTMFSLAMAADSIPEDAVPENSVPEEKKEEVTA